MTLYWLLLVVVTGLSEAHGFMSGDPIGAAVGEPGSGVGLVLALTTAAFRQRTHTWEDTP